MNEMETAVVDTLARVREGLSPYETGLLNPNELEEVANAFSDRVDHRSFIEGVKERILNSQNPDYFIECYLSIVFAQGFGAGNRYQMLKSLKD